MSKRNDTGTTFDVWIVVVSALVSSLLVTANVHATTVNDDVFKPLGNISLAGIAGRGINALLGIVGVVALLMFVYSGITWMTAGGSEEKISKAKTTMVWAALGLIVILSAMAITNFVVDIVDTSTGTAGTQLQDAQRQQPESSAPIDRDVDGPTSVPAE